MDALTELCDLIARNPTLFADKLAWICNRCPPPGSLLAASGTPHVSRSQLQAVLATARFLSKYSESDPPTANPSVTTARSLVIAFLRAISDSAFRPSFWPQPSPLDSVSSFFIDLLACVAAAADASPDFSSEVAEFFGSSLAVAIVHQGPPEEVAISRVYLNAVAKKCPPISSQHADRLLGCVVEMFGPLAGDDTSSDNSSSWCSSSVISTPGRIRAKDDDREVGDDATSDASSRVAATSGYSARSSIDQLTVSVDGGPLEVNRSNVTAFEEESVHDLEKQDIAFKLLGQVFDKVGVTQGGQVDIIRRVAVKQLKSLPGFLKIRKREWREQGTLLKVRINRKLSVCQAAVKVLSSILLSMDTDGKSTKDLMRRTLALLLDAAESCALSSWRKLRACEELYSSLLTGITQITVARGGQMLRVLLIPLKPLVLTTCTQGDECGNSQGIMFEAITKICCDIIEFGWSKDRALVDTFIMGLAACIRERNDHDEEAGKEKTGAPVVQLNLIRLLANLSVSVNKWEVVDMVLPLFIESLEEGDASTPCVMRLRLLDAVALMASLGFEKSYRETVVLMTRSYLEKIKTLGNIEEDQLMSEATTERAETLPAGFLLVASRLTSSRLRADYRHRLLSLCSDVGLAAESKAGRSGADFLGPLLPAVAEICSDIDPTSDVEPSLLKLYRNLWFYIVLFGLAPPIQQNLDHAKAVSTTLNSVGSLGASGLQAVAGPYLWNSQWSIASQRIAQRTPPLVVTSVRWLEDELELNSLHNPGSRRGSGNEKAAVAQRLALSAALGGRVDVAAMGAISGVKATYLLAVSFLEIIRFSYNGGVLGSGSDSTVCKSAFNCVFEYLRTPNLMPAVFQCLTAIVHKAFETAVAWLEDRMSDMGKEADLRESVLSCHSCFLIESMSQRDEHIRDISVTLLSQIKDKFPQVLWNSSCLNSLILSVYKELPSALVNDPALVANVRALYQKVVREWITAALSNAPCITQGLLQEKLCELNASQQTQHATDVISLLSEIRLCTGKNDCWPGIRTANFPAVLAAAAAASGGNLKISETLNFEVLSTAIVSATLKCNCTAEIAGMTKLFGGPLSIGFGFGVGAQPQAQRFSEVLLARFLQVLQHFVGAAERGGSVDKSEFRQICSQASALLLSNMTSEVKLDPEGSSQLLRLICWSPAYISTPDAMETGIFIWTWLISSAPELGPLVLAELVDAWLWTIDTKRGLFAADVRYSGPAAKLRPHLTPGEPVSLPEKDPVDGVIAHRLWLGFFIDRFEVIRHGSVEQLMLLGRMLQGTMRSSSHFCCHPAATGTFFTLMLFGLKFCLCQYQHNLRSCRMGLRLLEDYTYRASLGWFAYEPEWYEPNNKCFELSEAQSVSIFANHLLNDRGDVSATESSTKTKDIELSTMNDHCHPVWGKLENYSVAREKRKQLLLMLCQHEADRLEVWAQPLNTKDNISRTKISSEKWIDYARTAFSVDPRIALSMLTRFPSSSSLTSEITQLVQLHVTEIRTIPQALPLFVTPKAVEENSVLLHQLPHWAPCSITQALEFLTPAYKGHPRVMAYVLRVLETYPPEQVTFFMPQLVQALRYDEGKLLEGYLLGAARRSNIFAHILIWHIQGETCTVDSENENPDSKANAFQAILPLLREKIIASFTADAREIFQKEFDFFDKVTSISGVLYPLPKEERRAGIRRELEKITVDSDDLYLPTATNKLVRGIQIDSGIPLQSAAKVPIMITFNVVDRQGDPNDVKPQACIFKVGDDCRQDLLALQVISLLRDVFEAVGINLYLYPYGVLPTGPERGIIEVVPNSRSRSQMGEITDGGLYEIFQQDFGPVGSPSFETARELFIISSAGYAVASLLLQPKDRHNGNLLFDNVGRLVHIDFGFILETSPGGNMRFESAHFKLSHEMTQLLDPSGTMKSETWGQFVSLCVKGYLAARRHMNGIVNTVLLMVDSGLPCFSRGDPIGNLRKRFHPEMSEREAANFMIKTCMDAYNKWTTAGYDLIQYLQQGIEK